jgi:hypothetical protein
MQIKSLFNRFNHKDNLNILTIPDDELWNSILAETNHNFWYFKYNWRKAYPKPLNFKQLVETQNGIEIPSWLDFDLILCQNTIKYYSILQQYQKHLQIPIVLFNSYDNPGIDTNKFKNLFLDREQFILVIYDRWAQNAKSHGYYIWENLKKHVPTVLFGLNPGLSREITCVDELVNIYNKAAGFLNLTLLEEEHILRMIEAGACGCPAISVGTKTAGKFVINGQNGFISNNINDTVTQCKNLLTQSNLELSANSVLHAQQYDKIQLLTKFTEIINKTYNEHKL